MSALNSRSLREKLPNRSAVRAVASALGLSLAGLIVGIVAITLFSIVKEMSGIAGTQLGAETSGIQFGFAAVGLVFLVVADDPRRYVQLRWPTIEDLVWMLAIPIMVSLIGLIWQLLFLSSGHHEASSILEVGVGFAEQPILWLCAIGLFFLITAPAEELLYRGVIQGRVRPHLGTAGTVAVGAVAFGLMHAIPGLLQGFDAAILAFVTTGGVGGLLWGIAYERTQNLAVTAVTHAMGWVVNYGVLFGYLSPLPASLV